MSAMKPASQASMQAPSSVKNQPEKHLRQWPLFRQFWHFSFMHVEFWIVIVLLLFLLLFMLLVVLFVLFVNVEFEKGMFIVNGI